MHRSPMQEILNFQGKSDAINIFRHSHVTVICHCPSPVAVWSIDEDGVVHFERYLGQGVTRFRIRGRQGLSFEGSDKKRVHVQVLYRQIEDGEPLDHEEPPPPPQPANIFQEIRQKVQREMGVQREAFLTSHMPSYELDDDDPGFFEEELYEFEEEASSDEQSDAEPKPGKSPEAPEEPVVDAQ